MSDSDEPRVTHTEISSPYKDLSDIGDDGDDEMDSEEDEDADMDIDEEDEDDEMEDEEAEEEHSAPAYPVVVALPATAPSAEETEPFETDESAATPPPHPAYRYDSSPLSPWSSSPPQIPIPLSPPSPVLPAPPPSPIRSLGYRAATIRMRAEAAATSHSLPLPPPFILSRPDAPPPMPTSAPTSFPPLLLPSDRPEVNLPPRMGLGLALGPGYEVGESSAAAAARPAGGFRADLRDLWHYGIGRYRRDPERSLESWLDEISDEDLHEVDDEQGQRERLRWGTSDGAMRSARRGYISTPPQYDAQDGRDRRVKSGPKKEGRESDREIIQTLTDVPDTAEGDDYTPGTREALCLALQGHVTALQGQQGPARGPAQPELPEEAGSSS
ncbi:hypothetical protein Tco_0952971 [Tanacetum coccineum]|uniref:Uncharacterized protein n=1 Tax=Tanacetum coccineum TaxID=301880 RepID=A0ABQ5DYH1_9ASTR